MFDRRKAKDSAKKRLKKHYWIFVIACFIAYSLGIDYTMSTEIAVKAIEHGRYIIKNINNEKNENLSVENIDLENYDAWDVYTEIIVGNIEKANNIADEIIKNNKSSSPLFLKKIELGHRDGVFANIANVISSGSIFLTVFMGIHSIVKDDSGATIIFIVLSLLILLLVWAGLINVYRAVFRRIFLEGYIYDKVPEKSFIHFVSVKKYFKSALTMLVAFGFHVLWTFTIIGGFIKYFSYFLVPYIVAENPDISALDAINLSRRMMDGHKLECFKLKLSFIGWYILEIATLGLVGFFYSTPYMESFFTEYYVYLRELAKENNIENADLLNDNYLYKKADNKTLSEAYADVVELSKIPESNELPGNKIWCFFANIFGIVPMYSKTEQEYFEANIRKSKIASFNKVMKGDSYPERLNPISEKQSIKQIEFLNFKRHYSICSLIIMFFFFSFIGWFWEVCFHFVEDGTFINRGVLHGPWLPIYGSGGLMILILLNKFRSKPLLEFASAILLCGSVEYITAVILENVYHEKWWDYTGYFLNINSRVCAEGLLVFGIGGIVIVYIAAPLIDNVLRKARIRYLLPICIILVTIFIADQIYSFNNPNKGDGITNYNPPTACVEYRIDS